MKKPALAFPANRRTHRTSGIEQVVGDILSGWRYDISGLSPAMRTDYDHHLSECSHCRRRQQIARTIDVLLISVSTLSIAAFLLAAVVIRRVPPLRGTVHPHFYHAPPPQPGPRGRPLPGSRSGGGPHLLDPPLGLCR